MRRKVLLIIGIFGMLCADVKIDNVRYLDCLNEMFRTAARPGTTVELPNPAAAPAASIGMFNQAAVREMLGPNFGHSVVPWRPPAAANPPLLPR